MERLLSAAGFHVQGRRATCIHCDGSARLTVSFNDEVAFCHRCKWTANKVTLSQKLGKTVPLETAAHRAAREKVQKFENWINETHKLVAVEYRQLGRTASIAKDVLGKYPDCDLAWDALARFYHAEARLAGKLDLLCLEKVSVWRIDEFEPAV